MTWWQALLLGIVQGLTEFLPVSSSGHLMIVRDLLGVEGEGFLDFTVTVHLATVCSTLVVFWGLVWKLVKGVFRFRWNDESDYVCKLLVSMIPVGLVGLLLKDRVEALFGDSLTVVGVCLLVTAVLLLLSDRAGRKREGVASPEGKTPRNGISWWQALAVGVGQAFAVAPGLSRSGTTIATGLLCGVRRDVVASFSFLMVLGPILGEQLLEVLKGFSGTAGPSVGPLALGVGFVSAFVSGLFACKAMVALVRKARLGWFSLYLAVVALLIFIFA